MHDREPPTAARGGIRNPQDFYAGLALVAFALIALWAGRDLPGMRGLTFGAGTAPFLVSILLLLAGVLVVASGLLTDAAQGERWPIRGPVFFMASVLFFGAAVEPLGLAVTTFVTLIIGSAASKEVRWIESIVWSAILTAGAVALFIYGLKLPLHLWPR